MATVPSLRIIKNFPFKAGTRDFSNRYHFNGGTPANSTQWTTLADNVTAVEKGCNKGSVIITQAIGYAAGSDVPVFSKTYSLAGTNGATGQYIPGECAALVRYATAARTTKNHPKYLFNYYHGIQNHTLAAERDLLDETLQAALLSYANAWVAGFSDGAHTCVRASPQGDAATAAFVENYITHRDFPYTRSA